MIMTQNFFNFIITISISMLQHKRAQTAAPFHKNRHQDAILKEIKSVQGLQKMESEKITKQGFFVRSSKSTIHLKTRKKRSDSRKQWMLSPFANRIVQIQELNAKQNKRIFDFQKDQNRICQRGWNDFQEKIERGSVSTIKKLRKKANKIKNKAENTSIFLKNDLSNKVFGQKMKISQQKIKDLWDLVKGYDKDREHQKYFRVSDLAKDVKTSMVLKNAYIVCLNSKSYKNSPDNSFVDQKFKSFVYLRQNENKLSKKKTDRLLQDNFFIL